jgi:hypothetical protein
MAVTTYTATDVQDLKSLHAGLNVVRARAVVAPTHATGTITISSVICMVRIPNGAVIVDGYLAGGVASGGESTFNLGIRDANNNSTSGPFLVNGIGTSASASDNAFIAGGTLSAGGMLRFSSATQLPFKVSISDQSALQYAWLVVTSILGSGTATNTLNVVVQYLANTTS